MREFFIFALKIVAIKKHLTRITYSDIMSFYLRQEKIKTYKTICYNCGIIVLHHHQRCLYIF